MNIKIKLDKGAVMPQYSRQGDAGMDLTATSKTEVNEKEHGYIEYDTGVSVEIPEDFVGLVFPRGSLSLTGLIQANSVGVVDSNYRGTIKVRYKWIPKTKMYDVGERIAQLIIMPYPNIEFEQVDELSSTERGDKSFGSSGK